RQSVCHTNLNNQAGRFNLLTSLPVIIRASATIVKSFQSAIRSGTADVSVTRLLTSPMIRCRAAFARHDTLRQLGRGRCDCLALTAPPAAPPPAPAATRAQG